eukprot:1032358-Pelagomonas_calceolata.AAC.1
MLPRTGAGLISTIRFMMTEAETFLTAETGLDGSNIIAYWDLARGGANEPVHVYRREAAQRGLSQCVCSWMRGSTGMQLDAWQYWDAAGCVAVLGCSRMCGSAGMQQD